jgi:hypothetical protein
VGWLHKISRYVPIFHLPGSGFAGPREEALGRIEGAAIHLFARRVFTDMQILDAYATLAAFANDARPSTPLGPKPCSCVRKISPPQRPSRELRTASKPLSAVNRRRHVFH